MYDNIDFILNKDNCPGVDFLATIPKRLTTVTNSGSNNFGEYVNGFLGSLQVSITEQRVKVFNGSLCKFYLGDNFKTLSRSDGRKAIEKLSDHLSLPFGQATVTRIDAAQNLIMKQPERAYYVLLGEAQYYNRLEQNNGLYYNNGLRRLLFYGKEYEQKIKGQPIPELYQNKHILRYELRFVKRLGKQFKCPEIKASMLYDEEFYKGIVKRWQAEYKAINKINSNLFNMKPTGSTKELIANLALLAILELGQPNVLDIVKIWQESGQISRKQAYDLRATIKSLSNCPKGEPGNELISELDRKIKDAAQFG